MGRFTSIKEESLRTFFDLVKVSLKDAQEMFNEAETKGEAIKQKNRKELRQGKGPLSKEPSEMQGLGFTLEQIDALHSELHPKLDKEFNKIAASLKELRDHWDRALSGRETATSRRK